MRTVPYRNWNSVPVLFDVATAAVLFDRAPDTIKRLAGAGKIPAKKVGGEWVFEKTQIMRCLGLSDTPTDRIRDLEKEIEYLRNIVCRERKGEKNG